MDEPVKRTKGFKNILSLDAITAHYVRARTPASMVRRCHLKLNPLRIRRRLT